MNQNLARRPKVTEAIERDVLIPAGGTTLEGNLVLPARASGLVVFAHGSGSSRFSPRNRAVAGTLRDRGIGTLLIDLLTVGESENRLNVFDIPLLAERLAAVATWCRLQPDTAELPQGYFGASTGGGAALVAAANDHAIRAVVSRGGRPDLAGDYLTDVTAPTLLIVGGADHQVIALNREALARLNCVKSLAIVPGATHLFEEPGTLEAVARLAGDWFIQYLNRAGP